MIWFSIFFGLLAFLSLRLRRIRRESDLDPILWKWFVRLTWLGSIAFFQALELQRYLEGLTYRPFFGLFASLLFAVVVWISAKMLVNIGRRSTPAG